MRNFGGMQEFNPYEEFKKQCQTTLSLAETVHTKVSTVHTKVIYNKLDKKDFSIHLFPQYYDQQNPDCSSHGLIRASLRTKDTSWHGYVYVCSANALKL